jgi:hypothetical protein
MVDGSGSQTFLIDRHDENLLVVIDGALGRAGHLGIFIWPAWA